MVTFIRFGKKRRLDLMFEWLTLWPTWADLPVNSHRRDMGVPLGSHALRPITQSVANPGSFGPRTYNDLGRGGQVGDRAFGAGALIGCAELDTIPRLVHASTISVLTCRPSEDGTHNRLNPR